MPISCMNTAAAYWGPDAREFRPERWLSEDGLPKKAQEVQGHRHLLTFVDGHRMCLGRGFALAEFKVRSLQISPSLHLHLYLQLHCLAARLGPDSLSDPDLTVFISISISSIFIWSGAHFARSPAHDYHPHHSQAVLGVLIKNYRFELPDGPETTIEFCRGVLPRPRVAGEKGANLPMRVRRVD